MLHPYRRPLLWVRGVGLCRLSETSPSALQACATAMRLATFYDNPKHGDTPVVDDSTRLTLTTPPASEPVTLSEAKGFLRIEHDADDAVITRAIVAARQAAEDFLRLALLPQIYQYKVGAPAQVISLPVGPAQSISSISAIDADGNASTVSSDDYRLTLDGFGVIFTTLPVCASVTITYSAAFAATVGNVPALIKQGMLHHVAAMLEQRQGTVPLPVQSLQCYQPYRRVRL